MKRPFLAMAVAVVMASTMSIAPAAAAPDTDACHGAATSALASHGYSLGSLAARPPATTAGAISGSMRDVCGSGVPVPQVAAQVLADRHVVVLGVGAFLEAAFAQTAPEAAATLKAVGFDAVEIAQALDGVFAATDEAAAAILADLGYDATPIAAALREVYESDPPTAVALLKQEGFAAPAVALALRDSYDESAAVAGLFLVIAFEFDAIYEALDGAYDISEEWALGAWENTKDWGTNFGNTFVEKVLSVKDEFCAAADQEYDLCSADFWTHDLWEQKWQTMVTYWTGCWHADEMTDLEDRVDYSLDPFCWAGYGAGEFWRHIGVPAYEYGAKAVEWFEDPYQPYWLTLALHEIGYGATETADALKGAYDTSADWVVEAYHAVGYGATETADALRDAYGATKDWLVGAYHTVGYGATETADALKSAYGATKEWLVGAYHTVGYGATETADALKSAYDATADWTVNALHEVGYAAVDVANAMKTAYNATATWLAGAFKSIGYAASETGEALESAYNWTADQVESFIDDLYDIGQDIGDWFCSWLGC